MTHSGGKTHGSIIAKFNISACVGQENKKREKAEFIIFREIKVPGNIPVIQYLYSLSPGPDSDVIPPG